MFIIEDGRDRFYQWDLNRRLIIQDNSITEVHFCNRTDNCSLVVEVYEENGLRYANVPNILLQTDWRINVYAWDSEYTKHSIIFQVNARTKPADYVYTETEVKTWDALEDEIHGAIEALNDAEEKRITAEDQRALAEDIRIQNEEVRVSAEAERAAAEGVRAENELTRINAEQERIEKFDEIEKNAEEAKALVKESSNIFSNALKGHKSGAAISASGVSPVEHELDVKVSSKNLFKTSNYSKGSLSNGEISGYQKFVITSDYIFLKQGSYIISYNKASSTNTNGAHLRNVALYDKNKNYIETKWSARVNNYKFTLNDDCYVRIDLERANAADGGLGTASYPIENYDTFFTDNIVQLEIGTTATTYTPYIDVEGTKVTRLGKNFANLAGLDDRKKYKAVTNTASGYRIDEENNIIITTSPTTEHSGYIYISTEIKLSELCPEARVGMTLRFSAIDSYSEGASQGNVIIYLSQAAIAWAFTAAAKAITITQQMLDSYIVFYASYTPNAVRTLSNFQIELGDTPTEYEPYRESAEAIVDAEGNVKGLMSLAPNMTVTGENGTVIDCTYNRDINKAFEEITQALVSLGANI